MPHAVRRLGQQELDRHALPEELMHGGHDHAHATLAEHGLDAILPRDQVAGHGMFGVQHGSHGASAIVAWIARAPRPPNGGRRWGGIGAPINLPPRARGASRGSIGSVARFARFARLGGLAPRT